MGAHIVLVRHARSQIPTPHGPDEYGRPLTDEGVAQAERLVDDLTAPGPTLVCSSPYLRAVQTVEPAARAMGVLVHPDAELREWDSGLEPTPDYARHYAESWADPHFARPGGESLHELGARAVGVLTTLAERHPDGTVIVGSHGTFISRALVGFGLTAVDWSFSEAMPSPAIYRIRFIGRGVDITGPGL